MTKRWATAVLLVGCVWAAEVWAAGTVSLSVDSFQEVAVQDKDGKWVRQRQPVQTVVPGDEVIYVISYRNNGREPATDVVITNPVPGPVMFRAGTATAVGATDRVSVDGGQTYGVLDALTVAAADGTLRPATGADVTHVQWRLAAPVPAGASGSVSYRVVIE